MIRITSISGAVALWLVTSIAQAPADFSGRWTTDPDPATAAAAQPGQPGGAGRAAGGAGQRAGGPGGAPGRGRGDMGSGWGSTITITQNAATLTVEYTFFSRGDMQPPLRFVYDLTGQPTTNTVMMGRGMQTQTARARWDGAKLVLTTTHMVTDPATGKSVPADVTQTLTLESPATLVVETVRAGVLGADATTTKSTYRRIQG